MCVSSTHRKLFFIMTKKAARKHIHRHSKLKLASQPASQPISHCECVHIIYDACAKEYFILVEMYNIHISNSLCAAWIFPHTATHTYVYYIYITDIEMRSFPKCARPVVDVRTHKYARIHGCACVVVKERWKEKETGRKENKKLRQCERMQRTNYNSANTITTEAPRANKTRCFYIVNQQQLRRRRWRWRQ